MDSRHLPIIIAVIGVGLVYLYWQLNKKNKQLEEQLFYLQAHVDRLSHPVVQPSGPVEIDVDEAGDIYEDYDEDYDYEREMQDNEREIEVEDQSGIEDVEYDCENEASGSEPEPVEQEMDTVREIAEEKTPAEDVVITKISHCPHILLAGKNKGQSCGKQATDNGFCKNHCPPEPLDTQKVGGESH